MPSSVPRLARFRTGRNGQRGKVMQRRVQRHIGKKQGRAVLFQGALDRGFGSQRGGSPGQFIPTQRIPGSVSQGEPDSRWHEPRQSPGTRTGCVSLSPTTGTADRLKRIFEVKTRLLALLFHRGQVEAVLLREDLEDANRLQAPRDEKRERVRQNDRQNDGVIPADLEHHEHRREGNAEKSGEENAHAHQRISADRARSDGERSASQRLPPRRPASPR